MIRTTLIILASITLEANAQCSVNAGPDIDVCASGTVLLNGIPDGNLSAFEWRGGKGKFDPGRNSVNPEYTPSDDEAGTEVKLTLVGSGKCGETTDDILLRVNTPVKADAGPNQHLCYGEKIKLHGKITGQGKYTWISNGDGKFDDPNSLETAYTPSSAELAKKATSLTLRIESTGVCGTDESTILIMYDKGIVFTTPKDLYTENTRDIELKIQTDEKPGNVEWTSSGTGTFTKNNLTEIHYLPSLQDLQTDKVVVHVGVTDQAKSCVVTNEVVLHFRGK